MDPNVPGANGEDVDNQPGQDQVARALEPIVNEQEGSDRKAREAMKKALTNPLILREILKCFSDTELRQPALVNKQWNCEARSLSKYRAHRAWNKFVCNFAERIETGARISISPVVSLSLDARKARKKALTNPLILREIFKCLSDTDLSRVSAANQLWNARARSLRTHRGDCDNVWHKVVQTIPKMISNIELIYVPHLPLDKYEPRGFLGFSDGRFSLNRSNRVHIKLGGQHACSLPPPPAHELMRFRSILRRRPRMTLSNLHIHLGPVWYQRKECPLFALLNLLLPAVKRDVKTFSLLVVRNRNRFLKHALQDSTFDNLESLSLRDVGSYTTSAAYTDFIKKLVSLAPNLRKLYTRGRVNLSAIAILCKGRLVIHVTDYPYSPSLGEIPEDAASSLQVRRMPLIGIAEDFRLERFNRITSVVLAASRYTLSWMEMDLAFLLPLMYYKIRLDCVSKLKINLDTCWFYEPQNQGACNRIKSFDFKSKFPGLVAVEIEADWETHLRQRSVLNAFIFLVGRIHGNVSADRAINIKNLTVKWNAELGEISLEALAQMFPNLRKLSIRANGMIAFHVIWRCWPDLEELHVTLTGAEEDPYLNLDSVFCGIFPEEVAQLREKDDEYLKDVNVVPVMASITSLKRLRRFTLFLKVNFHSGPFDNDEPPNFVFSKVTPLIAFKHLDVVLITDDEDIQIALSHLTPYVFAALVDGDLVID